MRWFRTIPYFRFQVPTKPFFDQSWTLPQIDRKEQAILESTCICMPLQIEIVT